MIPYTIAGNPVTSIGYEAFRDCTGLTIPESVTRIEKETFYGCRSLTGITIPDSVTSIGGYAFYSCESLASIAIPDGVTSIGSYAFGSCSSLTSITFLGDAPTLGPLVFVGIPAGAIVYIPTGVAGYTFGGVDVQSASEDQLQIAIDEKDEQITELSQRPTLEQVRDGRPGSVLLSVDSEAGSVVLNFTVEESEDLITWTPVEGPGVS